MREWTIDSLFAPRREPRQRDPDGHRLRGMAGRPRRRRAGTLGWRGAAPRARCAFDLAADSLIGFDSLLLAVTGQLRDTRAEARPLGGAARGTVRSERQPRLAPGRRRRSRSASFEWQQYPRAAV